MAIDLQVEIRRNSTYICRLCCSNCVKLVNHIELLRLKNACLIVGHDLSAVQGSASRLTEVLIVVEVVLRLWKLSIK